jgi:hypothetical protein
MVLCRVISVKDGLKLMNRYLDGQFGHHRITTCTDPEELGRLDSIFKAMEAMPASELRAFLLPGQSDAAE